MIAVLLALGSAAAYGASDFVGGFVSRRTSAWGVAFVVQLTSAVAVLVAALIERHPPSTHDLLWGLVSGVGSGVGISFLFRGFAAGRMSVVAPLSAVGAAVIPVAVGLLTGFLGVGGGFLIVPTLLRYAKTPMKRAVGTSLAIIAANSASGLVAHWSEIGQHGVLAVAFTLSALVGLAGGTVLGRRMHPQGLKRAFAGLALVVATYLVAMNAGSLVDLLARRG